MVDIRGVETSLRVWSAVWLVRSADGLAGNDTSRADCSRGKICFEHLVNRRRMGGRRLCCSTVSIVRGMPRKGISSGEEGGDGDLVGGVEGDAGVAAGGGGFVGEAEAGEAVEVGLGEVELAQRGEVEGEGGFP